VLAMAPIPAGDDNNSLGIKPKKIDKGILLLS
jgi:hypothetical protein